MAMDEQSFWELIDDARVSAGDDDEAFLKHLERELTELPPNAIEGFRDRLDDAVRQSYRWDLWAAAYIINGGASDDEFEYFRAWLISRGRTVFDAALQEPASLEPFIPDRSDWTAQFEEFLYLPVYVYEQKTGREVPLPDALDDPDASMEPLGEPWDEETVEELFPGLAEQAKRRFSANT